MDKKQRHFEWYMGDKLLSGTLEKSEGVCDLLLGGERLSVGVALSHAMMLQQLGAAKDLASALLLTQDSDADRTSIHLQTVLMKCKQHGFPVWHLDLEMQHLLQNTEMPMKLMPDPVPDLPFDGMYIELESSGLPIWDPVSGQHEVEGFYVCKDHEFLMSIRDLMTKLEAGGNLAEDRVFVGPGCWVIVAVGKPKGKNSIGGNDDTLKYWTVRPGKAIMHFTAYNPDGKKDVVPELITKMLINLWYLWRTKHLRIQETKPNKPKSPKKLKRAARRGESFHSFTTVSLSTRAKPPRVKPQKEESSKKRKSPGRVLVAGHFHSYWVAKPGDEAVLETRPGKHCTLHKVMRYIAPYSYLGGGDPSDSNNTWRVRL